MGNVLTRRPSTTSTVASKQSLNEDPNVCHLYTPYIAIYLVQYFNALFLQNVIMPSNERECMMIITGFLHFHQNENQSIIPMDIVYLISSFDLYCSIIEYQTLEVCKKWKYLKTFKHPSAEIDKGVEFLTAKYHQNWRMQIDQGKSIASFLYNQHKKLDKVSIGVYLTKHEDVLAEYATFFNFRDKDIHTAFREFISGFKVLAEAPHIDMVNRIFTKGYMSHYHNDGDLIGEDVYDLTYAMVLMSDHLRYGYKISQEFFRRELVGSLISNTAKAMIDDIYWDVMSNPLPLL